MKNILLYVYCGANLVIVPNFVADDLLTYQKNFLKWLEKKAIIMDIGQENLGSWY